MIHTEIPILDKSLMPVINSEQGPFSYVKAIKLLPKASGIRLKEVSGFGAVIWIIVNNEEIQLSKKKVKWRELQYYLPLDKNELIKHGQINFKSNEEKNGDF